MRIPGEKGYLSNKRPNQGCRFAKRLKKKFKHISFLQKLLKKKMEEALYYSSIFIQLFKTAFINKLMLRLRFYQLL
jgi:predicted transcriptional regulator